MRQVNLHSRVGLLTIVTLATMGNLFAQKTLWESASGNVVTKALQVTPAEFEVKNLAVVSRRELSRKNKRTLQVLIVPYALPRLAMELPFHGAIRGWYNTRPVFAQHRNGPRC
jgi:hypothetical protein